MPVQECPGCEYSLEQATASCPDCGFELGPSPEFEFATHLRRLTRTWDRPPQNLRIDPPENGFDLIAWLDICDADGPHVLLTIGAHFRDGTLRCDRVHNQLFHLPRHPTELAMRRSGDPAELATATDQWLRSVLARPIIRQEWGDPPIVQSRTRFADTGAGLTETRDCPSPGIKPDRVREVRLWY